MINRSLTKLVLTLAAGAFVTVAQAKPSLKEVTDATEAAAAKAPDQAASIVEDKVKATPEYACPIIKAAIKGAKLQKSDETGLVAAALKAAPEKAPEIRACLADHVAGGKHPVGGKDTVAKKDPQKFDEFGNPITGEDPGTGMNDFHGVVGTYLSIPSSGGTSGGSTTGTTTTTTTTRTPTKVVKQTVFVPVTGS